MRGFQVLRGLREINLLLLLAVHIGARVVSMSFSMTSPAAVFITDALAFGQAAILVFWMMTPRLRWWSRLLAIALYALLLASFPLSSWKTAQLYAQQDMLLSWLQNALLGRDSTQFGLPLVLVESSVILAVLVVCRGFGFAVRAESQLLKREFHFSLKSLMGLTTLAALATGAIQWARVHAPTEAVAQRPYVLCALGCALAIIAIAALWAVLARRRWLLTVPIVAVVAGLLAGVAVYVWNRPEELTSISLWLLTHAGIVVGSLLVVRASGWRFGRRFGWLIRSRLGLQISGRSSVARKLRRLSAPQALLTRGSTDGNVTN